MLFLLGTLLLQAAWILAVPPFRGLDEFDHAYRASSVAEGYVRPDWTQSPAGRGDLIPVRADIVEAAIPVCRSYEYTGPDNCRAVERLEDGLVTVASASARYNPAFYAVVGAPLHLWSGTAGLYAMRILGAVLCAVMISTAAAATARWSSTPWPVASFALALTPVAMYSTTVVAPNGFEMASALCVWAGLLGLAQEIRRSERDAEQIRTSAFLALATVGGVGLTTSRTLGPLWLLTIFAVALLLPRARDIRAFVSRTRLPLGIASIIVLMATSLASGWTLWSGTNSLEPDSGGGEHALAASLGEIPLWVFQSIAAFPTRGEAAPTLVYAAFLTVFVVLMAVATSKATTRTRAAILLVTAGSVGVPLLLTYATYAIAGPIWQGRYTLPLSFGLVLVAGYALEEAQFKTRMRGPILLMGSACLALAHAASLIHVLAREVGSSPLSGDPAWISVDSWALATLSTAAIAFWAGAARTQLSPGFPGEHRACQRVLER